LKNLAGEMVSLADLSRQDQPVVLFFYDPNCGPCEAALPELVQWQRELSQRVRIVPVVSGGAEANRIKAEKYGIRDVLLQKKRETSDTYQVNGTPGAVLVSGGLIASPVASGIDEVRALVSRATLPRPVKKGEAAPSLRLPDLKGNAVDLGNLQGRRTLLLFWNPACGFCRQMLDDVKAWERRQPPDAPELLVISSGELKANQDQGFRARVLLDPYSAASQVFRSSGTPSAVMLNDEGIVASEVAVGASGVFELAGVAVSPDRLIH
jgi:thiol-disulfide isomerase/thioredoxin